MGAITEATYKRWFVTGAGPGILYRKTKNP